MKVDEQKAITWAPKAEMFLPFKKTKTKKDRRVPISTRLKAIVEMRRFDPAGEVLPDDRYVFGNAIGQRVTDVGRAWDAAVLKSHGCKAMYAEKQNRRRSRREDECADGELVTKVAGGAGLDQLALPRFAAGGGSSRWLRRWCATAHRARLARALERQSRRPRTWLELGHEWRRCDAPFRREHHAALQTDCNGVPKQGGESRLRRPRRLKQNPG